MTGYAHTSLEKARAQASQFVGDTTTRQTSLRELFLARALFRCGDQDGLARRILEEYSQDLRGHWARYAQSVLQERLVQRQ